MFPHARVTPVKNPIGNTVLTQLVSVMSLCFSREMIPVCTPITLVTHPNKTPKLLSAMGKWNGVTDNTCLFSRMMEDAAVRYASPYRIASITLLAPAVAAAPEAPMASRVKKRLRARRSAPRHAPVTRYARVRASREARVSFPRGTETRRDATGDGGGARFDVRSGCGDARRSATARARAWSAARRCARERRRASDYASAV